MTKSDKTKAEHKSSATGVSDKGAYEETAFGRRRISRLPKALVTVIRFIGKPIAFIYRRGKPGTKPGTATHLSR